MPARVVHDNIATEMAPVWRARKATPLTPRTVRNEYAAQSMEIPEGNRDAWMQARLTPLDKLLSDDEADCLERYVLCEQILAGNARCGDYTGDRVMTSRSSDMAPIADRWLVPLAKHHGVKQALDMRVRNVLQLFVAQQTDGQLSDAECAFKVGLQGRRRDRLWQVQVGQAAEVLVARGY